MDFLDRPRKMMEAFMKTVASGAGATVGSPTRGSWSSAHKRATGMSRGEVEIYPVETRDGRGEIASFHVADGGPGMELFLLLEKDGVTKLVANTEKGGMMMSVKMDKNKVKRSLQTRTASDGDYVYKGYTIGPRYIGKLMRIFKKHNLDAEKVGYVDDDLEVDLYGTREDLEAFLKGGGMHGEVREIKKASEDMKDIVNRVANRFARNMTAAELEIGDKVRYRANFLRSIGEYTGSLPRARGIVTDIQSLGGRRLIVVDWRDPNIPEKVLEPNLEKTR